MSLLRWLNDTARSLGRKPSSNNSKPIAVMSSDSNKGKGDDGDKVQLSADQIFDKNMEDLDGVRNYDKEREKLVSSEKENSWDLAARESASPTEIRAAEILERVREDERSSELFGNLPTEAVPGPETRDMGGKFLINLERIERSNLFHIMQEMPKGADLHLHFNAALNPELFVSRARGMPTMFIRSSRPLIKEQDFDDAELVFSVLPADTTSVSVFSETYNPEFKAPGSQPWMSWNLFCETFLRVRNTDPEQFVLKKMVLSEDQVYGRRQTVNGIWAKFNQATRCFKGLFNYESAYRWYIGAILDNFIRQKVMYAELRPMLLDKAIPTDDGLKKLNHSDQMRMIIEEVAKKQQQCGENDIPFGIKIIYCTPRSIPKPMMQKELKDCIRLKMEFPDLICGFDLVGAEDRPNSINFYRSELLAFRRTCRDLGIELPFLFHAGETLLDTGGTKDADQSNLFDVVMLESKRIGHGVALLTHVELIRIFQKRQTAVEICPISNEILHLCSNAKEHSLIQLLSQGIPCTISSDNPSLFSSSLTHDFYQVIAGNTKISLHGLKQLVEWSIDKSCLSSKEQARARTILAAQWEVFCQWIVDVYGPQAENGVAS